VAAPGSSTLFAKLNLSFKGYDSVAGIPLLRLKVTTALDAWNLVVWFKVVSSLCSCLSELDSMLGQFALRGQHSTHQPWQMVACDVDSCCLGPSGVLQSP
jgi:hypothetical protein